MPQEQDFRKLFLDEAREKVYHFSKNLSKLRQDGNNSELLNETLRIAHTLKATAGFEGCDDIRDILHEMESVLEKIKNNKLELNKKVIGVLFTSLDGLQEILADMANKEENNIDVSSLLSKLKVLSPEETGSKQAGRKYEAQTVELTPSMVKNILQGFEKGLHLFEITVAFESEDMMRQAQANLIYNNCTESGEVIKTDPPLEIMESEGVLIDRFKIFILSSRFSEEIRRIIAPGDVKAIDVVEINRDDFKKMVEEGRGIDTKRVAGESDSGEFRSSVRVELGQLNGHINKLRELTKDHAKLSEIALHLRAANAPEELVLDLEEAASYLRKHIEDIVKIFFSLMGQPLNLIFRRFERLIRNLSKEQQKEVIFTTSRKSIILDRHIIDRIGEAVIHLIRNSIDHGIELPDDRIRLGKPKMGNITLLAYTEDDYLVLQFSDDGRGFDVPLIRKTAVKRGFLTDEGIKTMSDEEVIKLIFKPGFSTKQDVEPTSGRGIGMDVVLGVVKELDGRLTYQSEPEKGLKFIMRLSMVVCQGKQRALMSILK